MKTPDKIPESIYYNPQKLLSYDSLFNFIVGERGNGKTYAFKKYCIDDYLRHDNQFYWLRRYDTELDDIDQFFADIKDKYLDHKFNVKGGKFYCDDKIMGFYSPLSKGITKKSVSFPKVNKVIFDEFLITKGNYHYLKNEVQCYFDMYETIARLKTVKAYFIANSTSEINPWWSFFGIKTTGRFTKVKTDLIVETTDSVDYRQIKRQSRFGKLIEGTEYAQYSIENKFVFDNKEFIEEKTPNSRNAFNVVYNRTTIGIWFDTTQGKIYCSRKHNPDLPNYCITTEDMKPNYLILKASSNYLKMLKNAFEMGYIYYENIKVKGIMTEVRKYLNIK